MNFIKNLWGKITHKANEAVTAVVEKDGWNDPRPDRVKAGNLQ